MSELPLRYQGNARYIFLHRFLSKALMYRFLEFGHTGEDISLDLFYVVILTSSCSCTHSSDNSLLPSCTRRRHFLSKAFVCCFLVFCRIGEYIFPYICSIKARVCWGFTFKGQLKGSRDNKSFRLYLLLMQVFMTLNIFTLSAKQWKVVFFSG